MNLFTRDFERYEGVRPINVYLLRLLFLLVALCVGFDSWTGLLHHRGPWDPVRAAAVCMWAAYSAMSVIGVFRPLRMLPIMGFVIVYKLLWLASVAYPLWAAGRLWGSPAEEMARTFAWVIVPIVAMPWKYAIDTWLLGRTAVR
jgi:hypothetical protein